MPVYLVRHAKAGSRGESHGPDELRPLSKKGRKQADRLADQLAGRGIKRIVSSPFVRCVETVRPLADRLGLQVEEDPTLAEGVSEADVLAVVRGAAPDTTVLCTHGDVIPRVIEGLRRKDGLDVPVAYPFAKGSTWVLEENGNGRFARGVYLDAP